MDEGVKSCPRAGCERFAWTCKGGLTISVSGGKNRSGPSAAKMRRLTRMFAQSAIPWLF